MAYISPLRYPGGKNKLANYMKVIFQANNLINGHYVEPYAGGASIALHLLFSGYASHIHINDLNKSIFAFWNCVLNDTDALCRLINDTSVTIETWKEQRYIQDNSNQFSELQLAFSTFFLNRTNRSGILSGGVIGGKNQDGNWLLNARYNKENLLSRIEKIARSSHLISLYNYDAEQFIINIVSSLPVNSFIYLDPPYYKKGNRLYQDYYKHDDHKNVANVVTTQLQQKWIVSYDDTPEICELYQGYRHLSYKLSYSAADRYKGSEIIFFCNDMHIPKIDNPATAQVNQPTLFFL